jgi:hypothetical protein
MKKIIALLLFTAFSAAGAIPTHDYRKANIQGWTVFFHKNLYTIDSQLGGVCARLLNRELLDIKTKLPRGACAKLQKIPIWVGHIDPIDPTCLGVYHPSRDWLKNNNRNPDKAHCVEFPNARSFPYVVRDIPSAVLHELSHGYHMRFLNAKRKAQINASWLKHNTLPTLLPNLQRKPLALPTQQFDPKHLTLSDSEYFAELSAVLFREHRAWSRIKNNQMRNVIWSCWYAAPNNNRITPNKQRYYPLPVRGVGTSSAIIKQSPPLTNNRNNRILLRRPMK